jgi:hypothetical protein
MRSSVNYLSLSCTEIRIYGADNPLVAAELRHMLDELRGPVPPWQVDALDRQVRLLEEAVAKAAL